MPYYPGDPWGLNINPCYPSALASQVESGFPLYLGDQFYVVDQLTYGSSWYAYSPIPSSVTAGKQMPIKRWVGQRVFGEYIGNGSTIGNSSHVPNWDEFEVVYLSSRTEEPASVQAQATAVPQTLEALATEQSPSRPTSSVHLPQSTDSKEKVGKTTLLKSHTTPVPSKKVLRRSKRKNDCEV
jgi:hypothetical protein